MAESLLLKPESLKVYLSEDQIQKRVRELASSINEKYKGCKKLTVIVILRGAFMFATDLVKHLTVPCHLEFIRLSSYGHDQTSSGEVKPVDLTLPNLAGEDVLIVEDIIDTGETLYFFKNYLESLHKTNSLKIAVLLDKKEMRQKEVDVDFVGFTVNNQFLIGYGLDFEGFYRNLPYIGVVRYTK